MVASARIDRKSRPTGYPARLERRLPGAELRVRPIVPADAAQLEAEFTAADAETLRMRFFVPRPRLGPEDFERLTTVDYRRRLALTAWDGDQPIAIARYEPADDTAAEVAFVVKPAYRGRGIGRRLIEMLGEYARASGYRRLVAFYLEENRSAATALAHAGFVVTAHEGDVVEVGRPL